MHHQVEIYTKTYCPYCLRAKELLRIKGIRFVEYDINEEPRRAEEMATRTEQSAVPSILIDDTLIGGCTELFDLDERGQLDPLLGMAQP